MIINYTESETNRCGDLVHIEQIKRVEKGYYVRVTGLHRVTIDQVYTYQNGQKQLFSVEKFQQLQQILWLSSCRLRQDDEAKEGELINKWQQIIQTVNLLFEKTNSQI